MTFKSSGSTNPFGETTLHVHRVCAAEGDLPWQQVYLSHGVGKVTETYLN